MDPKTKETEVDQNSQLTGEVNSASQAAVMQDMLYETLIGVSKDYTWAPSLNPLAHVLTVSDSAIKDSVDLFRKAWGWQPAEQKGADYQDVWRILKRRFE